MKPITAIIKEKGGAKTYPRNEEVTMNADGSGGPVSVAKFKKHNMFSKSGKVEVAETKKEHLALEKQGYGHESPAKQVRKAKNPATRPTNKVAESYDEKRSKRRGSGNYLPKVKEPLQNRGVQSNQEPLQNRGVQSNPAKERQRKRAIERESIENKRRENSPLRKKDACYAKVKSRYTKWPSAYASGALVKCRKVGAGFS
jgi:hypothetical protein